MVDQEQDYEPDDPDESDVCPHGKGFSDYCSICDEEDEFEDESIPTCPECEGDDLELLGHDDEGNNEYECNDCGERFTDEEE